MPSTSLALDRWLIAAGVVLTCVLFTAKAADPVNVVKLTALLLVALALVGSAGYRAVRYRSVQVPSGPSAAVVLLLLVGLVSSAVTAPVTSTAVLGAYGRNSGLLAYLSALALFVAALRVLQPPATRVLVGGIVFASLFTASYGLLQRLGVDAVPWNNPFNPVIAALGNPNFASGYLGIGASVSAGAALWRGWATPWRVLSGATAAACLVVAGLSNSVQGPIAAAAGLLVVAVAVSLDLSGRRRVLALSALAAASGTGLLLLLLGAVSRVGPGAAIFSDIGSRARVHYWSAALDMVRDAPWLGVGLDQYGSFWRASRSADAVAFLGGPSYSDAAHSVPLQVVAQGGVLLGLAYLAFIALAGASLVLGLVRLRGPDRMLLGAVGGGWAAYQVQSLVSIDQVPLIVLHFTLAGAVVAASGRARFRAVRLPGGLVAAEHTTAHSRRRTAYPTAPRQRPMTGADVALLAVLVLVLTTAAWQALRPLRANIDAARGDRLLAQGHGNAALEAYEQAAELVPAQSTYWGRQGALFEAVEQPARALRAWRTAAERDPFDVNALLQVARLAEEVGDLPAARAALRRAVLVDPLSPETLVASATFDLRHEGAADARRLLEAAVVDLPREASLWATLGDARAVTGDRTGAQAAYERALALQADQPTALSGLEKLEKLEG